MAPSVWPAVSRIEAAPHGCGAAATVVVGAAVVGGGDVVVGAAVVVGASVGGLVVGAEVVGAVVVVAAVVGLPDDPPSLPQAAAVIVIDIAIATTGAHRCERMALV